MNGAEEGLSLAEWLLELAVDDRDNAVTLDAAAAGNAVIALVEFLTEPLELATLTGGNVRRLLVPRSAGTKRALQLLALAYAHRPGYRREWAP